MLPRKNDLRRIRSPFKIGREELRSSSLSGGGSQIYDQNDDTRPISSKRGKKAARRRDRLSNECETGSAEGGPTTFEVQDYRRSQSSATVRRFLSDEKCDS